VEKNDDPRRKAARPKEHHPACIRVRPFRSRHAHVLRDEPSCSDRSSRITSSVQCGKPRRRERERERKRKMRKRRRVSWRPPKEEEEGRERKERGRGKRLECGGVAFNQSPASKCTVHVYVYCRRWQEGRERRAVYGSVSFCSGGCLEIGAKLVRRTRRGSRCLGLRDARH